MEPPSESEWPSNESIAEWSGGEADDFEFGRSIDPGENLVDAKHDLMLHFCLPTLTALKDRQSLQNHDRGVSDLERKVGYPAL
jgi:hypothetical protein